MLVRLLRWFEQTESISDSPISNQPFATVQRHQACMRQRHMCEWFPAVVTTEMQIIGRPERLNIHPRLF
jgi:hypothetical protein